MQKQRVLSRPIFAAISLVILFMSATGSRAQRFNNPVRVETGQTPSSMLTADLNGDGMSDILYTVATDASQQVAYTTGTVHTLMGRPGRTYVNGPQFTLPTDVQLGCLSVDADGDGTPDLVCPAQALNQKMSIAWFRGLGDGSFGAARYSLLANVVPGSLNLVAVADINRDGKQDVLVLGGYVMLGDGTGGFTPKTATSKAQQGVFQVADLNGDGNPDRIFPDGLYVELGKGDGTFGSALPGDNFSAAGVTGCTVADMDGDGRPDAVCTGRNTPGQPAGGPLTILHGRGDGLFDAKPVVTLTSSPRAISTVLVATDVNGDGIRDILGFGANGCTLFVGLGGQSFSPSTTYDCGFFGNAVDGTFYPGYSLTDLDRDGRLDLVTLGINGLYLAYGVAEGGFASPVVQNITSGIVPAGHSAMADFNGDGIPDIAVSGATDISWSAGRGDGTFGPPQKLPNGVADFSYGNDPRFAYLVVGDFNGDGRKDVAAVGVAYDAKPHAYLFFGHGDGTFAPPLDAPDALSALTTNLLDNTVVQSARFGNGIVVDLDGDSRDDLFYCNPSTAAGPLLMSVALSRGDGTFKIVSSQVPVDAIFNGYYGAITFPMLADFNGDGRLDVVYASMGSGLNQRHAFIVPGNGDGTFTAKSAGSVLLTSPAQPYLLATGDFDGDGHPDFSVLTAPPISQALGFNLTTPVTLTSFFGKGNLAFTSGTSMPLHEAYEDASSADLNSDGASDLILRAHGYRAGGNGITILHGKANRTFSDQDNFAAGAGLHSFEAMDVNRDGRLDLVATNADLYNYGSSVTVLLNLGNPVEGTLVAMPEPSQVFQSFDLIATFRPVGGETLRGNVSFSIDGAPAGTAALSSNAARITVLTPFTPGAHVLRATWPGDATYDPASLTGSHVVTGLPVTVTLTAQPQTGNAGDRFAFTAHVANRDAAATPAPGGTVQFAEGATVLGTATLDGSGNANISAALLTGGSHTITATYTGDATHDTGNASATVQVNAVATTLMLTSRTNPSLARTSPLLDIRLSMPRAVAGLSLAQTVTLTANSVTLGTVTLDGNGSGTFALPNTLPAGSYTVIATFAGTASLLPSTSSPLVQVINRQPVTLALTTPSATVYQGTAVPFTATLRYNVPAPTGTITIFDGTAQFAKVAVPASTGTSTVAIPAGALAVGTHTIAALYGGDTFFSNAIAASIQVTVLPSDFTLSSTPTSLTLQTQHHITFSLRADSVGNFADTLRFGAVSLPDHAQIIYTPTQATLAAGGSVTVSVYLETSDVLGYMSAVPSPGKRTVALAFLGLPLLGFAARRRRLRAALFSLALAVLCLTNSGCSGKLPGYVTPGSYTLHLTATGAATGRTHTLDIPLTVTP